MTEPVLSAKASLRQQVRELLNAMTGQQREAASLQICSRLRQQAVWKSAGSILFFAPLPGEPDIWPLLEEALPARKTVALPRFSPAARTYLAARIQNPEHDLRRGQLGIREPTETCAEFPLNRLDLVLVPGVAFDLQGRRLGRGKGFYDRLLAGVCGAKCGVAFDEQIVNAVPVGLLDIHLDFILTPTRLVEVKRGEAQSLARGI
jgi:5-formyltetrahydrofolate cyclo-ligase